MPNRLINESSPYLLQHAHNPVDWYPWGDEALSAARQQDRPIFLSIGYSACHWCHVMAHESFENPEIARYLNEHFISIKVDREERPDIDSIYMMAVQLLAGHGGWPLSVFLTPAGEPFYGGTYFPPEDRRAGANAIMPGFSRVLAAIVEAFRDRRADVAQAVSDIQAHLTKLYESVPEAARLTTGVLDEAARQLEMQYDALNGGFGGAPKFPPSMVLEFLFRAWLRTGRENLREMATFTLASMAHGGIFDQAGGGFHRYTVDGVWLVPHFEKMLYDNALLSRDYALAWQITGEELFRRVASETYDYVLRELTAPSGGFYSAQDADSGGVEGAFYVWTPDEITAAVGHDAPIVMRAFGVTPEGNFEGKNVLSMALPPDAVAAEFAMTPAQVEEIIANARVMLRQWREAERVWPGRDEKVLTAWNGLMLRSLAEGGVILGRPDLIAAAERNARFMREALLVEGRLLHVWKDGVSRVGGFLEDYANLLSGLIALYEATFDAEWIRWARRLATRMVDEFWDTERGGFFDTAASDQPLIVRPKEVFDSAVPSGNSEAAEALLRLALLLNDEDLRRRAVVILEQHGQRAARQPTGFGRLLTAYDFALAPTREIALAGDPADRRTTALLDALRRHYRPWQVVALHHPGDETEAAVIPLLEAREPIDGQPAAYVCQNYTCRLPVTSPEALAEELGLG
ncbi:MAG TPA: thioredoxin domain-containing protein [Thermomicrobiaceae bacterium]|nr:thioredoxin domain-containing protein [Thermomicrobiaceae bacterium]